MPKRNKEIVVKQTRGFKDELSKSIAERRKPRVAREFPALKSYSALPGHHGVRGKRHNGHLFIIFDKPRAQTRIPVTGNYNIDSAEAERRTGKVATPGEVWHHVADIDERRSGTIQLVNRATHTSIGHWGGSTISKRYGRAYTGIQLNSRGIAVQVKKPRRRRD